MRAAALPEHRGASTVEGPSSFGAFDDPDLVSARGSVSPEVQRHDLTARSHSGAKTNLEPRDSPKQQLRPRPDGLRTVRSRCVVEALAAVARLAH